MTAEDGSNDSPSLITVQDFRQARGTITAAGLAYVISMELHPLGGVKQLPDVAFSDDMLSKYEEAVSDSCRALLGAGGVWCQVDTDGSLSFNLVVYNTKRPVVNIIGGFGTPTGRVLEKTILSCLSVAVARVEAVVEEQCQLSVKVVARWRPGPDVFTSGATTAGTSDLQQRIAELQRNGRDLANRGIVFGSLALLMLVGAFAVALFSAIAIDRNPIAYVFGFLTYGLVFAVGWLVLRARVATVAADIGVIRLQQDLSEITDNARERRAQKMLQLHSEQLKRYYDQALQQRSLIFGAGLLCILAGFTIIGVAFWLLVNVPSNDLVKIVIGALGALGGILGNFIAVVYLRMFTETLKSVGNFHDRLVATHRLHFANFLAAKISTDAARDSALTSVAEVAASVELDQKLRAAESGQLGGPS